MQKLQQNGEWLQVLTTEISGLQDKASCVFDSHGSLLVSRQVDSLQNFTKTLAKQNDLEILEDRTQKAGMTPSFRPTDIQIICYG